MCRNYSCCVPCGFLASLTLEANYADEGYQLKDAALMVSIKLDREVKVQLTARVCGDVLIWLY